MPTKTLRIPKKGTKLEVMKRFRTIVTILLCFALPHAATAALVQGLGCLHLHEGAMPGDAHEHISAGHHAAGVQDARPLDSHQHPQVVTHASVKTAHAARDQCPDFKGKRVGGCECCNASAMLTTMQVLHVGCDATASENDRYMQAISELHTRTDLRPPITAQHRAA